MYQRVTGVIDFGMKLRAEIMLRIDELMATLVPDDAALVAFEVFRSYGNTTCTPPNTMPNTTPNTIPNTTPNTTPNTVNTILNTTENTKNTNGVTGEGGDLGGLDVSVVRKHRDPLREQQARELLEFLNQKTSRNFRPVEENLRFLRARLNTTSVADIKGVIARKTREWLNTEQAKYLRPATLFNATKFEQYMGEQGT